MPGLIIPAALVFRSLDQTDFLVRLDDLDPTLDQLAVGVGPVLGDLGDGRRAVPLEPGGLSSPLAIWRAMTISNAR